jgi:sulfur carrier protein
LPDNGINAFYRIYIWLPQGELHMLVTVNAQETPCPDNSSLLDLLLFLGVNPDLVVIELNGNIIISDKFAGTPVRDGDVIELARFVGGG